MTLSEPSRAVRLCGTEQPPAEERLLRAGPLSVLFDGANLRDIRMHGEEVIRAISFVVRDKDWATLIPAIADLVMEESEERFSVSYRAGVASKGETFDYTVSIEGTAARLLMFTSMKSVKRFFLANSSR
ncbi:MAG: hypothetical protein J0H80_13505 [Rhizobiales bacterium]|nr:hypothetical protein [Hyphomicrobiales bacterium]